MSSKHEGNSSGLTYFISYLNADGSSADTATYAVGSATEIALPACEAGYKWVNTVYGKPCGSPSDLSSAPVAAFTDTIDARNVYGDPAIGSGKAGAWTTAAVPEPSSALLLLMGLAGLSLKRRRVCSRSRKSNSGKR